MKVLFFGTGSIGKRHCVNLKKLMPHADLYFFRDTGKKDSFSEQVNAKILSSVEQITEDIDAAFFCAPAYTRKKCYEKIIQHNIPLYAEKPLISNMADLIWLKAQLTSSSYTAVSLVGFNLRFLNVIRTVKEILFSNKLGNVCRASFDVGQYLPDWRPGIDYRTLYSAQKSKEGGVILDLMHEIDLAYFLFGSFSDASIVRNKFSNLEIDTEDTAAIILHRASAPIVTINMDYVARKKMRHFNIIGDQATLSCDLINNSLVIEGQNLVEEFSLGGDGEKCTYIAALEEFLSAIKERKVTSYPLMDSIPMHELILARI